MTPKPIAIGLTLCEKVVVEQGTHNVSLINCFLKIKASEFPAPLESFYAYAALTDGFGAARMELTLLDLEADAEIFRREINVHLASRLQILQVYFRLRNFSFPGAGTYQFTLLVDDEWVAHRRLHVIP